MTNASEKSRLVWMDFVRGICILLVLVHHTLAVIDRDTSLELPYWLLAFNTFLDPFRMPLLMFLSGMLLHKSLSKRTLPYVSGKFTQIFWPFLIFSMLTLLAEDRLTLGSIVRVPITSPTVLWYLWFLVAYYILALVFVRLRIPLLVVAVVSLLLVPLLPDVHRLPRFAYLFFFFLMGHVVMLQTPRLKLGMGTALLGLGLAITAGCISLAEHSIKYDVFYIWGAGGMALAILSLAPFYRSASRTAWLEWIGRNSLVFYVVHFPVQIAAVHLLLSYGLIESVVPLFAGVFLASICVSVLVQMARVRSGAISALFDANRIIPYRLNRILQ